LGSFSDTAFARLFPIDAADAPDAIVPFLRLSLLDGTCADLLMFESAKVSSEIAVLDRGWGKPTERHEQVNRFGWPWGK
jgi:hypothetical protein